MESVTSAALGRGSFARVKTLDSARGVAALVVCLSHCLALARPHPDGRWRHLLQRAVYFLLDGAAAVDFFFVLSGFVLALPYLTRDRRPLEVGEFWLRRMIRIMPTYWVGIFIAIALRTMLAPRWSLLNISRPMGIDWTLPLTAREVLQHFLLIFGPDIRLVDGPIWSLAVEMQISLVLPFFILAFLQGGRLGSVLSILAVATITPYWVRGTSGIQFLPLFVLGVALANGRSELISFLAKRSRPIRLLLWGLAAALLWNRALQHRWSFPDLRQEFSSGLGSGLLILLIVSESSDPWLLTNVPITFLGQISYSFYLIHLPFLLGGLICMRALSSPSWAAMPAAVVAALAASTALHYAVERPTTQLSRRVSRWLSRPIWRRDPR